MVRLKQSRYFLAALGLWFSFQATAQITDIQTLVETLVTNELTEQWAKTSVVDRDLPNFDKIFGLKFADVRYIDMARPKTDPAVLEAYVAALTAYIPQLRTQVIASLPALITKTDVPDVKLDKADELLARNSASTQTWVDFHLNRITAEVHLRKALRDHVNNPSATSLQFKISGLAYTVLQNVAGKVRDVDVGSDDGSCSSDDDEATDDFSEFLLGETALILMDTARSIGFTKKQARGFVAVNLVNHMDPAILRAFLKQVHHLRIMAKNGENGSFEQGIVIEILAKYARQMRLTVGSACVPCILQHGGDHLGEILNGNVHSCDFAEAGDAEDSQAEGSDAEDSD